MKTLGTVMVVAALSTGLLDSPARADVTINIGTHLLANPADKSPLRNEAGQENAGTLGFEIAGSSGTSLINVAQNADIDGAVIGTIPLGEPAIGGPHKNSRAILPVRRHRP